MPIDRDQHHIRQGQPSWHRIRIFIYCFALALFCFAFFRSAWVVDDAYITFRTVDNFVEGLGLRWNPHERVQVYTHPLWMFLLSVPYAVTREPFFTSIGLSFLLCLAMLGNVHSRLHIDRPLAAPVFVLLLVSSKSVMDYSSSGLENPLSFLIAALFFVEYLLRRTDLGSDSSFRRLLFLASLAFVNRMDTTIIMVPALVHVLATRTRALDWRLIRLVLVATLPASLWLAFAIFYYGVPFPNTAYAKALALGVSVGERATRGFAYVHGSVQWEPLSYLLLTAALIIAVLKRSLRDIATLAGTLAYCVYVVLVAGSATHLGGRFLALPLLVSFLVLANCAVRLYLVLPLAGLATAAILWNPVSPVKMGTRFYHKSGHSSNAIDGNWHVHKEGMGLLNFEPQGRGPRNRWLDDGEVAARRPERVHVGGALGGEAIGYFGYAVGPRKIVVDYVGLSDPLLARLPAALGRLEKSGHFYRIIPPGYLESLSRGENVIDDINLRQYYRVLANITQGNLFSWNRFVRVLRFNLGRYDPLLALYLNSEQYRRTERSCRSLRRRDWGHFVTGCLQLKSRNYH